MQRWGVNSNAKLLGEKDIGIEGDQGRAGADQRSVVPRPVEGGE